MIDDMAERFVACLPSAAGFGRALEEFVAQDDGGDE
jgi:hypothetical protein